MTTVRVVTDIALDVETAAKWFAGLSDDDQAEFLIKVAEEAKSFDSPDWQWRYLGGHLRNCECSTEEAREMVRRWAYWIEHSDHGAEAPAPASDGERSEAERTSLSEGPRPTTSDGTKT